MGKKVKEFEEGLRFAAQFLGELANLSNENSNLITVPIIEEFETESTTSGVQITTDSTHTDLPMDRLTSNDREQALLGLRRWKLASKRDDEQVRSKKNFRKRKLVDEDEVDLRLIVTEVRKNCIIRCRILIICFLMMQWGILMKCVKF